MNTANRTEATELTVAEQRAAPHIGGQALTLSSAHLANMTAVANMMSSARATVPAHLRGNPGDCLAIVMQAARWGMDPFAVAQKTHLVSGTLGYEAQLVASVVNSSNIITSRMRFEWFGPWEKIVGKFKTVESRSKKDDDGNPKKFIVPAWEQRDEEGLGIKVSATLRGETEPRELTLMMTQARTRNSTLWTEDPKQQIAYLAQKRWTRLYAPDVLLGVYTPDEIDDRPPRNMGMADVVGTTDAPQASDALRAMAEAAADKGLAAYQEFWKAAGPQNRKLLTPYHEVNKARAAAADQTRTVDQGAQSTAKAGGDQQQQPPATGQSDGRPSVTYASVMDRMLAAKNRDALDVACDWVGEVGDPQQRIELTAKYEELCAQFQ